MSIHIFKAMLPKSFAFNIFRFLKLSYSLVKLLLTWRLFLIFFTLAVSTFCTNQLRFQRICLWRISALKDEKIMKDLYLLFIYFFFFVCFKCYCFRLKQSLILQIKPNHLLRISQEPYLCLFKKISCAVCGETWVSVCRYVSHICLHLIFCLANLY